MSAKEYTERLRNAFAHSRPWMYEGKDGALRLAREHGACLADSPVDEAREAMQDSYISLCVRGYNISPPIDAGEWYQAVKRSYEKSRSNQATTV